MEPALLWEDDPSALAPIMLRYPDGSRAGGWRAFVCGVSELVYRRPEAHPAPGLMGGVVVETFADVALDDDVLELRWAASNLREAVSTACDRLERAGDINAAAALREAATLAGFPPARPGNPLA